mmetsp:Transcript_13499/g.19073  ORF Transcript_13499/g.19073 Transcript_13499/m.19073 type:complete len:530 (+) Transcript_13499:114-1703(+)
MSADTRTINSDEFVDGLEYEAFPSGDENSLSSCQLDDEVPEETNETNTSAVVKYNSNELKLMMAFFLMIIMGTLNSVFNKVVAIPFYNYPNFLNVFGMFVFTAALFVYIIPASKYGWFNNAISPEQRRRSKRPFAIMGGLDCITTTMQVFASIYLPGPLLILLPQAAIPISMAFSNRITGERFRLFQYAGAIVVIVGILVVLEPLMSHRNSPDNVCEAIDMDNYCTICQTETTRKGCLSHRLDVDFYSSSSTLDFGAYVSTLGVSNNTDRGDINDDDDDEGQAICKWVNAEGAASGEEGEKLILIWSLVMILSCIPMTLSSIYKEIVLSDDENELDPVYLNGWIALFQSFYSIVLAVPGGISSSPPVSPSELPEHFYDGFKCYLGEGTITTGCHPDDMCSSHAFLIFNLGLLVNIIYMILMMYILKYGSASLLYLALTITVPLGNLAFALPFMPGSTPMHLSDTLGLFVIMMGLVLYRSTSNSDSEPESESSTNEEASDLSIPLVVEESQELLNGFSDRQEPLLRTGDI